MTTFILCVLAFAGGYAASIYTWDKVKMAFVGVETEIKRLEDRIRQLAGR